MTTVPIPATATTTAPAAGIDGWSDYTEYGTPRDGSTTATTGGSVGYGWLGAKQRSTTSETAGLALMGDRLHNAITGRFSSLDPVPGGNTTAHTYPADPKQDADPSGMFGCSIQNKLGYRKHACIWSRNETAMIAWLGIPASKWLMHYVRNPWGALALMGGSAIVIFAAWKAMRNNQRLAVTIYTTWAGTAYWATVWRTRN